MRPDDPMPLTDAEWYAVRDRSMCEAAACTSRVKPRSGAQDRCADATAELRDRLNLCKYHYRAIENGIVGCWGEPPLDVLWRLGQGSLATWYRNETRLSKREVDQWFRDHPQCSRR